MKGFDLIVVGVGMLGAACAERASAEGLRVAVVDPGPVGGGVTAASMGHLVAIDGDPAELALVRYSLNLWPEWLDDARLEYSRCGTLWVAGQDDDEDAIDAKLARLQAGGVTAEKVDARGLRELEPELAPGLAGGVRVADEGIVYPPAAARMLMDLACARGAVRHVQRVVALTADGVQLQDQTHLHAAHVVVAAGTALPSLLPELPLSPRKGHLLITQRYPGRVHHQLVQLGYADSVHAQAASVAFNVQPRPTGQLLIGSSREYGSNDTTVSLPVVQRMLQRSFDFLPGMRSVRALRMWAGLRPATPDGRPYLGRVPGRERVWVAAGHEGLGVTTAPGSARLLVDAMLGRKPALDMAPFDPGRVLS